jgi:ATP-dependent DNA helicase RecQ
MKSEDDRTINRVSKYLENQNQLKVAQLKSVLNYVENKTDCKSKIILDYFGENTTENLWYMLLLHQY